MRDGDWAQVSRASLGCDEPVKLGGYKTTARTMLAAVGVKFESLPGSEHSETTTMPRRRD